MVAFQATSEAFRIIYTVENELFIAAATDKCKLASEKCRTAFAGLEYRQLNWKPSAKRWSMAQCLEHLIIADSLYFPLLRQISDGSFRMNWWARYSPLTGAFGSAMKQQLRENVGRPMKTSPKLEPGSSDVDMRIVDQYQDHLETFAAHIEGCLNADLDIVLVSPVNSFVTYSLRDAITFLVQHEHRHLNQAVRVKEHPNFPS